MSAPVTADELRAKQAPLKEKYKADPASAQDVLRARGEVSTTEITVTVETRAAVGGGTVVGLHPATGGSGAEACSGDMLLQALVACAGVTLRSVATSRGIEVAGTVRAEGDLDFRGTLGVDRDAPVGFRSIRLRFDLESAASADDLAALVSTTERYCVVFQTLANRPDLSVSVDSTE